MTAALAALALGSCGDDDELPTRVAGPVWIDADPAIGLVAKDPDDGWAIAHALVEFPGSVRGISLGFGNTDNLLHQEQVSHELREAWAPSRFDLPIAPGAATLGAAADTPAARALIAALTREPLTILALGRLSNVAAVLALRPDLAPRIRELVILGGRRLEFVPRFGPDEIQFPDSNVEGDAPAVEAVLAAAIPITLIPTELTALDRVRGSDLDALANASDRGAALAEASRSWLAINESLLEIEGFHPFDLFVTVYASDAGPELVGCQDLLAQVSYGPDESFQARAGDFLRLQVSETFTTGRPVRYCSEFAGDGLDDALTALAR